MSVKCHEIISTMETLAPPKLAESWDNVGLMLGSQNSDINKILFALDCSEAVINEAIEIGANMIITHHPFIFKPIKTLDFEAPIGKRIKKAIVNNINIYSAHTNLDIAEDGTNSTLSNLLELNNVTGLFQTGETSFLGKIGYLKQEMTLNELANFVKEKLNLNHLVISGNKSTKIKKVGLCTGKGTDADFMQIAKNNDCQCYITGDLGYHDAQYAQDIGLCVIDGTHYFTEVIIVPVLCEYIKNKIPNVECVCSKINGQTLDIL